MTTILILYHRRRAHAAYQASAEAMQHLMHSTFEDAHDYWQRVAEAAWKRYAYHDLAVRNLTKLRDDASAARCRAREALKQGAVKRP